MCLKNGIEIEAGHAERREIVELFGDAVEVAAEIVVVAHLARGVRLPHRLSAPVVPQNAVGGHTRFRFPGAKKAVGKDLIHDAARRPVGRFEVFFETSQLPQSPRLAPHVRRPVRKRDQKRCAVVLCQLKAIAIDPRVGGRKVTFPPLGVAVRLSRPKHAVPPCRHVGGIDEQKRRPHAEVPRQTQTEMHRSACRDRADGRTVGAVSGRKIGRHKICSLS